MRCSKKVKLPESITAIEDNAFSFCYSLKEINIPNRVTAIGESAFEKCEALEKIDLLQCDKLKKNEKDTFWACNALKK